MRDWIGGHNQGLPELPIPEQSESLLSQKAISEEKSMGAAANEYAPVRQSCGEISLSC
jgi:hypothetical protein